MIWFSGGRGREQTPRRQCNSCIPEQPTENSGAVPQILVNHVGKLGGVTQLKASKKSWVARLPSAFREYRRELGLLLSVGICEHKQMWLMKRKDSLAAVFCLTLLTGRRVIIFRSMNLFFSPCGKNFDKPFL